MDTTTDSINSKISDLRHAEWSTYAPYSPVWIYLSSGELAPNQSEELKERVKDFATQWLSHGQKVESCGDFLFDRFIVLAVNAESLPPSGCSIDSSVHFVREMESRFSVDFFDRMQLAWIDGKEDLQVNQLREIPTKYKEGSIDRHTLIFDNTITTVEQLLNSWIKPLEKSWVKNYVR
nr:hypothetical protein [Saprospiraceae bacterium]